MRIAGSNRSEHRKPLDVNVWERKNGWFDLRFAVDAGSCTMQLTAVYLNPLRISFWISVIDFDCARSTMLGCHHLKISKIQYRLVVYLPLWKIWKSVGIIIPNWMEKTCSKPPTSLNLVGGSVNSFKIRLKQRRRINWVSCFLNPILQVHPLGRRLESNYLTMCVCWLQSTKTINISWCPHQEIAILGKETRHPMAKYGYPEQCQTLWLFSPSLNKASFSWTCGFSLAGAFASSFFTSAIWAVAGTCPMFEDDSANAWAVMMCWALVTSWLFNIAMENNHV